MGGDNSWQAQFNDPVRWKFKGNGREFTSGGAPKPEVFENELASVKMISMHKPTHETYREETGEYPFSSYLTGKRRMWEIRLQLRFKQLPQKPLYFGIELPSYVPLSTMSRQAQKALVGACRRIIGDCYHSPGDDPATTKGELEPPTFVMPLWAFDQFIVSEPGTEPDIMSNLEGKGMKRSDGVRNYTQALTGASESFSTDMVYTFSFWGISQFLDIYRWEVVGGILPGVKTDFNKFCGSQPVSASIYELTGVSQQDVDKRHLPSRKRYFFSVSAFSVLKPPSATPSASVLAEPEEQLYDEYPIGFGAVGKENAVAEPAKAADMGFDDLLGMDSAPAPAAAPAPPTKPLVESFDLLDLGS